MNILAVSIDYPPDALFGAGIVNAALYEFLAAQGWNITVLTPGRQRESRVVRGVEIVEAPIEFTQSHLLRDIKPGEAFATIEDIENWNDAVIDWSNQAFDGRRIQPCVVHNHGWVTHRLARHLSKRFAVPLVGTVHVIDRHYVNLPGVWHRATERRFVQAENLFIEETMHLVSPSVNALATLLRYFPNARDRCSVVPHGMPRDLDAA